MALWLSAAAAAAAGLRDDVAGFDPLASGIPISQAWIQAARGGVPALPGADVNKPVTIADVDRADRYAFEDPFQDMLDFQALAQGGAGPGSNSASGEMARRLAIGAAGQGIQYGFGRALGLLQFGETADALRDRIGTVLAEHAAARLTGEGDDGSVAFDLLQSGSALALASLVSYATDGRMSDHATMTVTGGLNRDGGFDYALDTILPLWETGDLRHTLFAQGTVGRQQGDPTLNAGVAYRYMTADERWLFGLNAFYDRQFADGLQRMSIGVDAGTAAMGVFANRYIGLSGWADVGGGFEERAASGWDLGVKGRIASLPQVGWMLKGYEWDQWQTSPDRYGVAAGIDYSPFEAVTIGVKAQQDSEQGFGYGVNLGVNLQFGAGGFAVSEPADFNASGSVRELRYRKVERENEIVTERRKQAPRGYGISAAPVQDAANYGFSLTNAEIGTSYRWTISGPGGEVTGSGTVTASPMVLSNVNIANVATGAGGTLTITAVLTNSDGVAGPVARATAVYGGSASVAITGPDGAAIGSDPLTAAMATDLTLSVTGNGIFSFTVTSDGSSAALSVGFAFGALASLPAAAASCTQVTGTVTSAAAVKVDVSCLSDGLLTVQVKRDGPVLAEEKLTKRTKFTTTVQPLYGDGVRFRVTFGESANAPAAADLSVTGGTIAAVTAADGAASSAEWIVTVTPDGSGAAPALTVPARIVQNSATKNTNRASDTVSYSPLTVQFTAPGSVGQKAAFGVKFSQAVDLTEAAVVPASGFTVDSIAPVSGGSGAATDWTVTLAPQGASLAKAQFTLLAAQIKAAGTGSQLLADTLSPDASVDTVAPPVPTIGALAAVNSGNSKNYRFGLSGLEGGSSYHWSIADASGSVSGSDQIATNATDATVTGADLSALADGKLTLTVWAEDAAGNKSAEAIAELTKDVQAPEGFTVTVDTSVSDNGVPVVNAEGMSAVRLIFKNLPADAESFRVTFTQGQTVLAPDADQSLTKATAYDLMAAGFGSGDVSVTVTMKDEAGNTASATGIFRIVADGPAIIGDITADPPAEGDYYDDL